MSRLLLHWGDQAKVSRQNGRTQRLHNPKERQQPNWKTFSDRPWQEPRAIPTCNCHRKSTAQRKNSAEKKEGIALDQQLSISQIWSKHKGLIMEIPCFFKKMFYKLFVAAITGKWPYCRPGFFS